jgi:hypothetical protein
LEKKAGSAQPHTALAGWKVRSGVVHAFALPKRVIDLKGIGYRWSGRATVGLQGIGRTRGDPSAFRTRLAALTDRSDFVAFAAMCGLAGPLRRFVKLPESPVFAFFGPSSTGKTTLLRIAAAMQGDPGAVANWNATGRGLEEAAATCNDLLLPLNAAELCTKQQLQNALERVIHMLPEGESMRRSTGVQDRFPDLSWMGVTLSTSNAPGSEMARRVGRPWDLQDEARFIDVPVPSATEGGIFNRLEADAAPSAEQSGELIGKVEALLENHYGVFVEPWIRHLASSATATRVAELTVRFLKKVGSPMGLEERVARKFALIYAAGVIANSDANLLGWPKGRPLHVTKRMYRMSRTVREGRFVPEPVRAFVRQLGNTDLVRPVKNGIAKARGGHDLLAVLADHNGRAVFGVRQKALKRIDPLGWQAVVQWLRGKGVTVNGQGGKATSQLPIDLIIDGRTIRRPRLLLLDRAKLE